MFVFLTFYFMLLLACMHLAVCHDTSFCQQDGYSKVELSDCILLCKYRFMYKAHTQEYYYSLEPLLLFFAAKILFHSIPKSVSLCSKTVKIKAKQLTSDPTYWRMLYTLLKQMGKQCRRPYECMAPV